MKPAVGAGKACGDLTKTDTCNTQACAPVCQRGDWTNVGTCSKPCGTGTQAQTRQITCAYCPAGTMLTTCGPQDQSIPCNTDPCPVDCVVIAGRGHEAQQLLAAGPVTFSDRDVAREAIGATGGHP